MAAVRVLPNARQTATRLLAAPADYAFEVASSNIRYGPGVTREIGLDLQNLKVERVLVMTDKTIGRLPSAKAVFESLASAGIAFDVFDDVRVEPSEKSFKEAIKVAKSKPYSAFVAVGGGSVIDTCKAANLYACHPEADFLDFVNAPIGKGKPVLRSLKPLIAVPETAPQAVSAHHFLLATVNLGTGSETTGTAIFDFKEIRAKTGITSRAIRPLLGIVDPLNTSSMPSSVRMASGLDVLCHALESFTALPYDKRRPRPTNPINRPAYQGANPVSDLWSIHGLVSKASKAGGVLGQQTSSSLALSAPPALRMCVEHLPKSVHQLDEHAQGEMVLAATYAGIGFGNAGVHLCHGLSYPISGLNKSYRQAGYEVDHPLVPHGVSVAITAPSVFEFTAPTNPERHLQAAAILGANVSSAKASAAGPILADALRRFLQDIGVPNGLSALGYTDSDIPELVAGALPQQRVLQLSPEPAASPALGSILEKSMTIF